MSHDLIGQTLKGSTKSVLVEEDAIIISYKPMFHGFVGDKRIPYKSITAIQFKEPGSWLAGYVQFSIQGAMEWRGPVNQDENAIQFDKKDGQAFQVLRDFVQAKVAQRDAPAALGSVADELSKLAHLRDQGILTDDEFAVQKAKLLR